MLVIQIIETMMAIHFIISIHTNRTILILILIVDISANLSLYFALASKRKCQAKICLS